MNRIDREQGLGINSVSRPLPIIAGGSDEIRLGTYPPLVVEVEGRGPVKIPNFMPDEVWKSTMEQIGQRYATNIAANVPGGKLTEDTLIIEQLNVESMEVMTVAGALLQHWWEPDNVKMIGKRVPLLPDALMEVSRKVVHLREAFNLTVMKDMELGEAWIKERISKIKAGGGSVDERNLSDLEFA